MPQPTIEPAPTSDQALVAAGVAGVALSAFDRLSQAVQDSVPAPQASDPGPTMAGGKTLEDLVKEMLRPMLKEWLDRNLPPMVERFVEREIVRLTRR
jgi:cell pole-organizing protein PopZ